MKLYKIKITIKDYYSEEEISSRSHLEIGNTVEEPVLRILKNLIETEFGVPNRIREFSPLGYYLLDYDDEKTIRVGFESDENFWK